MNKLMCVVFFTSIAVSSTSFGSAKIFGCYRNSSEGIYSLPVSSCRGWDDSLFDKVVGCAPEVKESNIAITDSVLTGLTEGELKNAASFKELISAARSLPGDQRIATYLSIIGIKSDTDLVNFVGARTPDEKYIDILSKNANLTYEQSAMVLQKVSNSLLGQRN